MPDQAQYHKSQALLSDSIDASILSESSPVQQSDCAKQGRVQILTNSNNIKLTKADIPDSLIVDKVNRLKWDFSMASTDFIKLMNIRNEMLGI